MRLPFMAREVRVHHHATLQPVAGFEHLVSASVGPSGEAVGLWADQWGTRALAAGDATEDDRGPLSRPPVSVAVTVQPLATTHVVRVSGFTGLSPLAQPLPNGRVLIVGGWARWRPEGPDLNAVIYGSDGDAELAACVGDGVEKVLATKAGAVWVGYHDMGIFGGNGWGEGGGPEPIAAPGLVRFSPDLEVEWRFPGDRRTRSAAQEPIDDCEAVTLAGDTLWAYYYTQYPVACIERDEVRVWPPSNPAKPSAIGIQALATDGRHVALAGGYQHRQAEHRVVVARLEDRWVPERRSKLVMPDGSRLPAGATMQGFGETVHVFADREWYKVGLDEL